MTRHDLLAIDLDRVAETVADLGIDAVEADLVDAVATRALALGATPTLAAIAVDPAEPSVARIRAFARLLVIATRPTRDDFALAA